MFLLEAYDKKTNAKIPLGKQAIINAITKLNERAEKRMPGTRRMQNNMSKRSANFCTPGSAGERCENSVTPLVSTAL